MKRSFPVGNKGRLKVLLSGLWIILAMEGQGGGGRAVHHEEAQAVEADQNGAAFVTDDSERQRE